MSRIVEMIGDNSGVLGILLLVLGALVVLAIVGFTLRFAVGLYNHFVGGEESERAVEKPSNWKAMGMSFVIVLINSLVETLLSRVLHMSEPGVDMVTFVVGFVVMSALLSWMLPTTFVRSLGVMLCWYLVIAIIVVLVLVVVLVVSLLIGLLMPA